MGNGDLVNVSSNSSCKYSIIHEYCSLFRRETVAEQNPEKLIQTHTAVVFTKQAHRTSNRKTRAKKKRLN